MMFFHSGVLSWVLLILKATIIHCYDYSPPKEGVDRLELPEFEPLLSELDEDEAPLPSNQFQNEVLELGECVEGEKCVAEHFCDATRNLAFHRVDLTDQEFDQRGPLQPCINSMNNENGFCCKAPPMSQFPPSEVEQVFGPSEIQAQIRPRPSQAAPIGSCPALTDFPSAETCQGQASECWSPGVSDLDCVDQALCCFDGCKNACFHGDDGPPDTPIVREPEFVPNFEPLLSEDYPEEVEPSGDRNKDDIIIPNTMEKEIKIPDTTILYTAPQTITTQAVARLSTLPPVVLRPVYDEPDSTSNSLTAYQLPGSISQPPVNLFGHNSIREESAYTASSGKSESSSSSSQSSISSSSSQQQQHVSKNNIFGGQAGHNNVHGSSLANVDIILPGYTPQTAASVSELTGEDSSSLRGNSLSSSAWSSSSSSLSDFKEQQSKSNEASKYSIFSSNVLSPSSAVQYDSKRLGGQVQSISSSSQSKEQHSSSQSSSAESNSHSAFTKIFGQKGSSDSGSTDTPTIPNQGLRTGSWQNNVEQQNHRKNSAQSNTKRYVTSGQFQTGSTLLQQNADSNRNQNLDSYQSGSVVTSNSNEQPRFEPILAESDSSRNNQHTRRANIMSCNAVLEFTLFQHHSCYPQGRHGQPYHQCDERSFPCGGRFFCCFDGCRNVCLSNGLKQSLRTSTRSGVSDLRATTSTQQAAAAEESGSSETSYASEVSSSSERANSKETSNLFSTFNAGHSTNNDGGKYFYGNGQGQRANQLRPQSSTTNNQGGYFFGTGQGPNQLRPQSDPIPTSNVHPLLFPSDANLHRQYTISSITPSRSSLDHPFRNSFATSSSSSKESSSSSCSIILNDSDKNCVKTSALIGRGDRCESGGTQSTCGPNRVCCFNGCFLSCFNENVLHVSHEKQLMTLASGRHLFHNDNVAKQLIGASSSPMYGNIPLESTAFTFPAHLLPQTGIHPGRINQNSQFSRSSSSNSSSCEVIVYKSEEKCPKNRNDGPVECSGVGTKGTCVGSNELCCSNGCYPSCFNRDRFHNSDQNFQQLLARSSAGAERLASLAEYQSSPSSGNQATYKSNSRNVQQERYKREGNKREASNNQHSGYPRSLHHSSNGGRGTHSRRKNFPSTSNTDSSGNSKLLNRRILNRERSGGVVKVNNKNNARVVARLRTIRGNYY